MHLHGTTQLISLLVSTFIWSLIGLTEAGATAAIKEALAVASDNPDVLTIVTNTDGSYTVTVVGAGKANLIVTTPEDLVNGIPAITEVFEFTVYDPTTIATHFEAAITGLVFKEPPAANASTTAATA